MLLLKATDTHLGGPTPVTPRTSSTHWRPLHCLTRKGGNIHGFADNFAHKPSKRIGFPAYLQNGELQGSNLSNVTAPLALPGVGWIN
jgi:hypothetical protein